MAVSKPSWLRNWLGGLNWDILTFHVYVGDAIEDALDWAIGWINWGIDQAEKAWDTALDAWYKAVDLYWLVRDWAEEEFEELRDKFDTWWDDLGDWWEGKKQWVLDRLDAAKSYLLGVVDTVREGLSELVSAWYSFWQNTWPQWVKDFNTLLAKVTNFFTTTLPGLAARLDITKAFNDFRLEWKDLFNFWGSLGKDVTKFFTDPVDFLWDKVFDYIDRKW